MYALIIAIAIIAAILAFFLGYKLKVKVIFDKNNNDYLEERQQLKDELDSVNQEIQTKNIELNSIRNRSLELDKEYDKKIQIIKDASNLAKKEHDEKSAAYDNQYKAKIKLLDIEYNNKVESLNKDYQEQKDLYSEEIAGLDKQLKSLQQQKSATIEALERENAVREQADLYRLNISQQEIQDVGFLKSIQYRISKPRVVSMLIWQTYFQPLFKEKTALILGKDTVCGIYKITNLKNQKTYIGQAVDVRKRWADHCKCGLGIDTPQGNKLYQAIQEDGLENFTFELLESCEKEKLDEKEKYYISLYNSCEYGYNSTKGNN